MQYPVSVRGFPSGAPRAHMAKRTPSPVPPSVEGRVLLVDGNPFFLRAGEVHYFRLPKDCWEDRLRRLRDAGFNTVSSYMPWYWHEPDEGTIDLDGRTRPERDLRGFLALCARLGLKAVARPGPFVNSELCYGGYPRWVFERYPETVSRRADGVPVTGRPAPAEGEPVLRRLVERWYAAVAPLCAEFGADRGGPVILFQPDNEISAAWTFGLTNSLYDPSIIGEKGLWPAWLLRTYGSARAVARRYGSPDGRPDLSPPRTMPHDLFSHRRALDWLEFKRAFFADWGITLARWASAHGVAIPFVFNEPVAGFYTHGDHPGFGAALKRAGLAAFTACHAYADRICDLEGCGSIELAVELVKASPAGGPPVSIESNHTWTVPRYSRSHVNAAAFTRLGLGHGLNGLALYVFAAGTAFSDDTIMGDSYWEDAAVALDGTENPSLAAWAGFNRFVGGWEREILATVKEPDVLAVLTPAMRYASFLGAPGRPAAPGGPAAMEVNPEPGGAASIGGHEWMGGVEGVTLQRQAPEAYAWKQFTETLLLLRRLNVSWGLVDPLAPAVEPGGRPVIVQTTGILEREAVSWLCRHLEAGGSAVFYPTVPVRTPDGRADRRLAEMLGVAEKGRVPPPGGRPLDYRWKRIECPDGLQFGDPAWLFLNAFRRPAEVLASFEGAPAVAATPAGAGRAVVSGVHPFFATGAHCAFWRRVLARAGVRPQLEVSDDRFFAVRRATPGGGPTLLTVANLTGDPRGARVAVRGAPERRVPRSGELFLGPSEVRCLWLDLPLASNTLLSTTHEIVPADDRRAALAVRAAPGERVEMAFARPAAARVGGCPLPSLRRDGCHCVEFVARAAETIVTLRPARRRP